MKRHILLITAHDIWGSKDSFSPMYKILHYLGEKGYIIDFYSIEKDKSFDQASKIYGEPINFIHENVKINRIRVGKPYLLKVLFNIPIVQRLAKKIRVQYFFPKKIEKIIKRTGKKYDLIYAYEIYTVRVSKKISEIQNIPLVTRFQGSFLMDWYKQNDTYYFNKKYKLHIDALGTPAELIIMTNDGTQGDQTLKMLNNFKNVEFLRNGIDFKNDNIISKDEIRKELGLPLDKVITISVARLTKWKKHERIIYAYEELKKRDESYLHVFIGDGEELELLKRKCSALSLDGNMIFIGQVNHENVSNYLNAADIFISVFDSTNIGNPLQEAIKKEMPIVTYDVGDTSTLIQDEYNGVLLKSIDKISIADAIEKINKDDEFRKQILKGISETSKSLWTWDERLEYEETKIRLLIEGGNS